jgi:hypothetical protein
LLAEPEPVPDGSAIDWYVAGEAKGTRLSDLRPVEAQAIERDLDSLTNDIRGYAEELTQPARSTAERSLGLALQNALQVPSRDYIYAVGDQPVLVAWAHRLDKEPALPVGLVHRYDPQPSQTRPAGLPGRPASAATSPAAALPPRSVTQPVTELRRAPAGVAVIRRHPWQWPWWLLFAALVLAILWTLLPACALNIANTWYPGLAWCGGATQAQASPDRIADLQALIADLEGQLARRARECPLQAPPSIRQAQAPQQAAPEQRRIDEQEIKKRVDREQGQSGELQISLGWNGPADLDLYVRCPTGETISYQNRSACSGKLDVDMNAERKSDRPVENVTFPSIRDVPPGKITIGINWFNDHGDTRDVIPATIVVRRPGQPPKEIKVEVRRPATAPGSPVTVGEITVP